MIKQLSVFSKIFIICTFGVIVFKIEFFPFSNYQMYSNLFLPKTFVYYKLTVIDADQNEVDFVNKDFQLFFVEEQLIESIYRKIESGSDRHKILKEILIFINNKNLKKYSEIKLYKLVFNWAAYKNTILLKDANYLENVDKQLISSATL